MGGHFSVFNIAASGLSSELKRIEVISSNIANVNSTRTPEGGPYRRKDVVFTTTDGSGGSFDKILEQNYNEAYKGVKVERIYEDQTPFIKKYDPQHPDADKEGYVSYPNINVVKEMVNLMNASRSYGANVTVLQSLKNMISKAFDIGR
jgi:flagellar basal-body rod protein FlgC